MKKFILSLTLLTIFTFNSKAQHQTHADENVTTYPPKILFNKQLPASLQKDQVEVIFIRYAPGEISKPHRHPMATVGYVLDGEIEHTFEGVKTIYKKGDVFWEEPAGLHDQTRNISKTKEATLVVFFVGAKGSSILVPEKAKK
ncbi:MAG: cupin domain-containing protein [Chitinophagaceae bacterium]